MAANSDFRILKEKKVDRGTDLKITQNLMSGRIFVEFRTTNPNLLLQKSFQNNRDGELKYKAFAKSIRSTGQLREHFGLKGEK